MSDVALKALIEKLGKRVLTDKEDCFPYSFDGMKMSFLPSAVIRISEEGQVGDVLKLANEYKIPVTTRGAGSSLTGSASACEGGWVLDLTALNSIAIDTLGRYAFVGAGAITKDVDDAAKAVGLFYPPDPSSARFCTIGGNIACNAGGLRCVKYGVTRDYVVALKGYLASGEAVSWGMPLRKFASGYNLRDLWVGSEGTLGVVTSAVLKLIPRPESRWTLLVSFKNDEVALKAAERLSGELVTPSIFEFMDSLTVEGVERQGGGRAAEGLQGASLLLLELDGSKETVEHDRVKVLEWVKGVGAEYREARTEKEAEKLWSVRREGSSSMFAHGSGKLNEDIVVPLDKLGELMIYVKKLMKETGLKMPVFGHAGDGNFHVNIMYDREDDMQTEKAQKAVRSLMEKVVELGGAITGEHGIGLAKSTFLKLQHTNIEIDVMKAVKKALDPSNILNPGKIFKEFKPWEHKPVKVKLPWDHY